MIKELCEHESSSQDRKSLYLAVQIDRDGREIDRALRGDRNDVPEQGLRAEEGWGNDNLRKQHDIVQPVLPECPSEHATDHKARCICKRTTAPFAPPWKVTRSQVSFVNTVPSGKSWKLIVTVVNPSGFTSWLSADNAIDSLLSLSPVDDSEMLTSGAAPATSNRSPAKLFPKTVSEYAENADHAVEFTESALRPAIAVDA